MNKLIYDVHYFDCLDSTNSYAKAAAKSNAPEGQVIIANKQTSGYGRIGRSFCSPENSGLYMSIILRPELSPSQTLTITTAAAVAVATSIEEIIQRDVQIKWVNDIYLDGKKICGILCESGFVSGDKPAYAILGIGINLYPPKEGFPENIKQIAGTIFDSPCGTKIKKILIDKILCSFDRLYKQLPSNLYLEDYKKRCMMIGKTVEIVQGNTNYFAHVLGIDDQLRLIVDNGGEIQHLNSAEISVRL